MFALEFENLFAGANDPQIRATYGPEDIAALQQEARHERA